VAQAFEDRAFQRIANALVCIIMRFAVETLDDALLKLYPELLSRASDVVASRGKNTEILGVLIEIEHARARLSRSETRGRLFSSLGELLWYLSGDNRLDFIERYIKRYRQESEDYGKSVYGGYGPRLLRQRGNNQIENVIALLREHSVSRRAVIQIFNAEDIASKHTEIPCTTTLQFFVRDERVHLIVNMRSNDAVIGFPHDVFCFTMLQEIVARTLGCELGSYRHFVGSMHLYDKDRRQASDLIEEGFQARIEMPSMPSGDPWPAIGIVLAAEARVRGGESFDASQLGLDPYWSDLIRMLQVFFSDDIEYMSAVRGSMSFQRYRPYIDSRINRVRDAK
jgi:thymidylate synthase